MPTKSRKSTTTKKPKQATPAAAPPPTAAATAPAMLAPGAVLKKLDRAGKVRCECTVEAGGFRFEDKLYSSISAVAAAAAKSLGLSGNSFNGYVFWGLAKPSGRDGAHRLEALWQRYSNAASTLLKTEGTDQAAGMERLRQHLAQLKALV